MPQVLHRCPVCGEADEIMAPGIRGLPPKPVHTPCACDRAKRAAEESLREGWARARMARRRGAELSDLGLRRPVAPGRRLDRWRRDVGDNGLLRAIKDFLDDLPRRVEQGVGLLISGRHRCGKSFALDVVDAETSQAGFAAAHESEEGFHRALRATYGRAASHTERDIIAAVSRADILIIDDLGAASSTEWGASATERLVDAAYQARVPIVAATRLSDHDLAAALTRHAYACVVERTASIALPDRDLTAALRDATRRALETTKEG